MKMKRVHMATMRNTQLAPDGFWLYYDSYSLPTPQFAIPRNEVMVSGVSGRGGHTFMLTTHIINNDQEPV